MKKLVFIAGLFATLTLGAQQGRNVQETRPTPPTTEQMMHRFDDLNLSKSQKRKLKALFEEREAQRPKMAENHRNDGNSRPKPSINDRKEHTAFDNKIQKILTKSQYEKFKAQQPKMGFKDNKTPIRNGRG